MPQSPAASVALMRVQAMPAWQRIDFISDLHLEPAQANTFAAWSQYMAQTTADALFILGDLFEVWVGDDNPDPFAQQCAAVLRATALRLPVYFMRGNRDFLVGPDFIQATGMHDLPDPTLLDLGNDLQPTLRLLLSHGDALCLDDHAYLAFRAHVRTPEWQAQFLAQALTERQAYARQVRAHSQARKQAHTINDYADVDTSAAIAWLQSAQANILLHGHTHRAGQHDLGQGLSRWVLSDWDAQATPPRLQVLSWQRNQAANATHGLSRQVIAVKN